MSQGLEHYIFRTVWSVLCVQPLQIGQVKCKTSQRHSRRMFRDQPFGAMRRRGKISDNSDSVTETDVTLKTRSRVLRPHDNSTRCARACYLSAI
jgi:hypothetical protein